MPVDDLYAPIRPAGGWTLLAVGLLAVVAAWYAWVWWRTRPLRPAPTTPRPVTRRSLDALRASYMAGIDAVVAEHAAGRLDQRAVVQALSPLVRRFAFEASGFPAHTKSLAELEREHPGALPTAVATMYPGEFAERSGDVEAAVSSARRLVEGWR